MKSAHTAKVEIQVLRSKYDGKTLAFSVNGTLVGPDVGPWTILKTYTTTIECQHEEP